MSSSKRPKAPQATPARSESNLDALGPEDAGALRIGATDEGMVRLIITTRGGVTDLDFPAEDAREIAEEILAAAARCDGSSGRKG